MRALSTVTAALCLTLGCGGSTTPTAAPTPAIPPATFTIVSATPAAGTSISLPVNPGAGSRTPTIEFQFTYPQDLTLGVGNTNFQVALLQSGTGTECMATQIAYSTRLDRSDNVYLANSAARFRTGFWVMRDIPQYRCGASFTTDKVVFNLGQGLSFTGGLPATVNTGWAFVVQ
jgi:hypothetical protein